MSLKVPKVTCIYIPQVDFLGEGPRTFTQYSVLCPPSFRKVNPGGGGMELIFMGSLNLGSVNPKAVYRCVLGTFGTHLNLYTLAGHAFWG